MLIKGQRRGGVTYTKQSKNAFKSQTEKKSCHTDSAGQDGLIKVTARPVAESLNLRFRQNT